MVFDNAKLLLRLLWRPADAMSGILDQGSLLFASLAVLAVSLLVQYSVQSVIPRAPVAVEHTAQPQETEQDEPALPLAHAQPWWSFSFYAPLSAYLVEGAHLLGASLRTAMLLVFAAMPLLAGGATYAFLRRRLASGPG